MLVHQQLIDLFSSEEMKAYLKKAIAVPLDEGEKYKSWLGFNYDTKHCTGFKIYFSWFKLPEEKFIAPLLPVGGMELFHQLIKQVDRSAVEDSLENGSGYSFGVKADLNKDLIYAFGFNVVLQPDDLLAIHSICGEDLLKDDILPYKGVYYHYKKGQWYAKTYYYLKNQNKIKNISNAFHFAFHSKIETLELGFGDGFHPESDPEDVKMIALGNYDAVWSEFESGSIAPGILLNDANWFRSNYPFTAACPGIYFRKQYYSYYLYESSRLATEGRMYTIEEFIRRNHRL